MKQFGGEVIFLDRSDINTDEIIPAKYLTEISKQALQPYLLEDLKLDGFNPKTDIAGKKVIITRENFGCGSSREHAPWALEANGIHVVIAINFARIFRQNMFNCGLLAIEIDKKSMEDIFRTFSNKDSECKIVLNDDGTAKIKLIAGSFSKSYPFKLDDFEKALVENEGWIGYADKKY
jgi:3-isopropylmalate/(R)-2-methylmalate dehydratase small subunit